MSSTINASTSSGIVLNSDTSGVLQLQTASTTAVTIDASQNVGVGTSSPAVKLQVIGSGRFSGFDTGYYNENVIAIGNASFNPKLGMASNNGYRWNTRIKDVGGNGEYVIRYEEGSLDALTIDRSGNLGLGVTPSAWAARTALQVVGAAVVYQSGVGNGNSSGYFNNFYQNSGDRVIVTGYAQGIVLNPSGAGEVKVLTTSSTTNGGGAISFIAGPYVAAGGTSWTNSSDERLKNITGEIQNGLSKVCSLRAAEFTWKDDESNKPQIGLIAQDVQAVLPEVINASKKYNSEDETEYLGINYTETIPLLVAAIKELSAQVTELKAEVQALKGA